VRISIAIPTGALFEDAVALLDRAGVAHLQPGRLGRRLLMEKDGVRVILVRPTDVPAYVDHGAADLGIVGKDVLWESPGAHYELLDLRFGACRLVVAVPEDSPLHGPETWPPRLRLATKYPRATARYMGERAQAVEVVRLHGSVELAPQVDLTDGIVDLTASGRTLAENRLRIVAEVGRSTARLIANQASVKTRSDEVQRVTACLREAAGRC
jgi:ATP phosphoribosyltransferase